MLFGTERLPCLPSALESVARVGDMYHLSACCMLAAPGRAQEDCLVEAMCAQPRWGYGEVLSQALIAVALRCDYSDSSVSFAQSGEMLLGPEQTWLRGEHTGVPQPCVESPRRWEMPRDSGPLWTVLLKGGHAGLWLQERC